MNVSKKQALFVAMFAVLALIGQQINFSALVGAENQFFTLFQFFAPIAGAFLGPILGVIAVLSAEAANFAITGKELELLNLARLLPMLFAAYYFASTSKKLEASNAVPLLAIAAFIFHPIGAKVWYFSLFWLIPILAKHFFANNLLAKSLGATFTAHAIGGALWIWTVQMPAEAWIALIPIVMYERVLFALGIAGAFIATNTVLYHATSKNSQIAKFLTTKPEYALFKA